MIDGGRRPEPLRSAMVALSLVLAITGCAAGTPSPSPSLAPSEPSLSPSEAASSPSAAASVIDGSPPTSSSNVFGLLPAQPPADLEAKITCTGSIGPSDAVALVELVATVEGESGELVLRDYADMTNPRTACTFTDTQVVQLIDARHIVIGHSGLLAVVDLPEVRFHWFKLPDSAPAELATEEFLAVGPDLDQVLWMTTWGLAGTDTIHLSTSAGTRVIATLPTPGRGRCGSPETDSKVAAYTHSGSHLFVLNQPLLDFNSLVVVEGETAVLSLTPPSAGWGSGTPPLMALWSPTTETLYYRLGTDVFNWSAGSDPQLFLADVAWVKPTISADGSHLAYSVLRPDGLLHDVFLVDLAQGGSPVKIGAGPRKVPAFVNSTQLYYRSEGESFGCAGAEGEKPLIYNIVDGSEGRSIFEWVRHAWPSTSSNL